MANLTAIMDPAITPAALPPPGVTPNFEHPDSWAGNTIGICSAIVATAVIGVAIRVFTKLRIMRQVDHEDYVLVIAMIILVTYNGIVLRPEVRGFEHLWERPLTDIPDFLYSTYMITPIFCVGIVCAKWAVLLQLQRVFAVKRLSPIWWIVRALITLSTLFYIAATMVTIWICSPRERAWNPLLPGHCINSSRWSDPKVENDLIACILNTVFNCGILAVPVMGLRTLQIPFKQKVIIGLMFSGCLFSLACSIARLAVTVRLLNSTDAARDIAPEVYLADAEIVFFILATILPTMPRFWQWCRGRDPSQRKAGGATTFEHHANAVKRAGMNASKRDVDTGMPLPMQSFAAREGLENGYSHSHTATFNAMVTGAVGMGNQRHERVGEGGILRTVEFEVTSMV